ncbi:MAG: hypothetical protein ACE5GW_03525, partial [Planctomycetota bacterium]
MRSIDARFHGPVRVLLGSLILIVGCHGARARAPEPRSGAAFEEPAGGALASYGAWTRHTGGAAGEDLFADPLPVGRGLLFSSNRHSHEYKIYLREGEGRTVRRITAG